MTRLIETIAQALDAPVTAESRAGDPVVWDSLGHLRVILAVEEEFKVMFRTALIPDLGSVAAIADALRAEGCEL